MYNFVLLVLLLIILIELVKCRSDRVKRIVGGVPAEEPGTDEPIVFVRFAGKTAKITGVRDFPHYVFRGIRYAEKPEGKYRFQRPKQHFLQGEIQATKFPFPCLQPVPRSDIIVGDEDCLFLNIFTPDLPDGTEGLPVVVWIHGGGFRYGSASQYGVQHLVGKKLLVVTIQYRLGSLGFLSTGSAELPGNVGIWDMALAVQWVRNYIGFFGGNPHKIVVMGHGSGASSSVLMSLTNIAKGLTSAVVAMSGTAVSNGATQNEPSITALEVATHQGCPTANFVTMVKCLQKVPAKNVIKADTAIEKQRLQMQMGGGMVNGLSGVLGPMPVTEGRRDGRSLPPLVENKPIDDMMTGNTPKIPILTGITKDETKKAIHGRYKGEIQSLIGSIDDFINKVLIGNLQNAVGKTLGSLGVGNVSALGEVLDPLHISSYIRNRSNSLKDQLEKVAEVTGDGLFNLPAFMTVNLWSKNKAPAYLYRFDYAGRAKKGNFFLDGLPIVDYDPKMEFNDTVAHGDDLSYIFDAYYLNGTQPPDAQLSKEDAEVREHFTQLIADFARHGEVRLQNSVIPQFSLTQNNFIRIGKKPNVETNFRFCEMALWASIGERLQSSACSFLSKLPGIDRLTNIGKLPNVDDLKPNIAVPNIFGKQGDKQTGVRKSQPLDIFG